MKATHKMSTVEQHSTGLVHTWAFIYFSLNRIITLADIATKLEATLSTHRIRVSIRRDDILNDALRYIKKKSFNPKNKLNVQMQHCEKHTHC